ncbi:YeiH family protein [Streptococcus phocae subsp. salmonis]|uniref:YeiH family protein n=1 Tax=Streptococcus phocae TaxID=119224 RepID=UPI000530D764|nr:YeiH family protein [Streptococcus phocae]KGR73104.1 membrane protein [Streptococcus phocae subsp. salmonis]
MSINRNLLPGVFLCLLLALPSWYFGHLWPLIGGPVFAILIGMLVAMVYPPHAKTKSGVAFTSKYVLQAAVVLLGFGLNVAEVMAVGIQSLPIILATIITALLVAFGCQKLLKLDTNTATLVGVGSSICGGSAIAATAPVIGAKDDEIAKAISVIFLFNILAALLFPTLGQVIGLSNQGFALFAGTAVNDTSSVTATAAAWDAIHHSNTLDGATIVKLTRTLAIIPITLLLSFYQTKKEQKGQASFRLTKAFPTFILFFLVASLVTTLMSSLGMPLAVFQFFKMVSKFFIVMAMVAIGLHTDLLKLIKTGGKALLLGGLCWIAIAMVSLLMQAVLHIL